MEAADNFPVCKEVDNLFWRILSFYNFFSVFFDSEDPLLKLTINKEFQSTQSSVVTLTGILYSVSLIKKIGEQAGWSEVASWLGKGS
jgi:hypothetical protein